MTKTFIVETGKVDSNNDVILLEGLKFRDGKKIPLLKDFDAVNGFLGHVDVFKDGDTLKATADLPDFVDSLYPAIGFQIIKSEPNEFGGKTITEAKLYSVGLSASPNVDPLIKRISEQ